MCIIITLELVPTIINATYYVPAQLIASQFLDERTDLSMNALVVK